MTYVRIRLSTNVFLFLLRGTCASALIATPPTCPKREKAKAKKPILISMLKFFKLGN